MAKAELEERLHLSEARKLKLEQRVAALAKQNAALAKGGQVQRLRLPSCRALILLTQCGNMQAHTQRCSTQSSASMRLPCRV